MKAFRRIVMALCCSWIFASNIALAQPAAVPPHAPQIQAIFSTGEELKADLKFLVDLAGTPGTKAWKALAETLDTFLIGLDLKRPLLVEVLMSPTGSENRVHFPLPVADPQGKGFLGNLDGFGIKSKRLATGFFELKGSFVGYLRVVNGHAVIVEQRNSVPANLPDPAKTFANLIAKKFDAGLLVKNEKQTKPDQDARKKDFQKFRENLQAGIKQKPDESAEDFQLRKGALEHHLAEMERFISESAELSLGWITDSSKRIATLDLDLTAIPGTDLDAAAQQIGKTVGMFASVPRSPDAIVSGRINFPLDSLRKNAALGAIPLARVSSEQRIDAATEKTAEQKETLKKASGLWFDMLNAGTNAGIVDGLIEVSQVPGEKANLVFGLASPDGSALKAIVELIPIIRPDLKIQIDADKVGDISIHKIELPVAEKDEDFELIFGKAAPVYVVTATNAWWVAIGEKSLDQLKAAIGAAGKTEGVDANNFLTFFVKAGPLVEILDSRRTRLDALDTGKKLTEAEAKSKKERDAHRKLAIEAFKQGKDSWETKLHAKDGKVTGSTVFEEGIMRFIGSAIAKFSNDTLK